jgi:hypothetical protein
MSEAVRLPIFGPSLSTDTLVEVQRPITEAISSSPTDDINLPPEISWQDIKHSFGTMRERLRAARAQTKALGRLAMLDIDGAQANLRTITQSTEETDDFNMMSLKDRIRLEADHIRREQKQKRRHLARRTLKYLGTAAAGTAVGLLESRVLNK